MISIKQQYRRFLRKKKALAATAIVAALCAVSVTYMKPTQAAIPPGYEGQFIITVKTDNEGATADTAYRIFTHFLNSYNSNQRYTINCDINNTGFNISEPSDNVAVREYFDCEYSKPGHISDRNL